MLEQEPGYCTIQFEGSQLQQLNQEAGGLRLQRIPPTEKRGRVHTSTVTVAVLDPHARVDMEIQDSDLLLEWYSGSGAGGQHRNKHQNSCRLTHTPTGVTTTSQTRSRQNSYENALAALRQQLIRESRFNDHIQYNQIRKQQVGSGERGDKVRTLYMQRDLVVDHRNGKTITAQRFMRGHMNQLWSD